MSKIDLIISKIESAQRAWHPVASETLIEEALTAARELKDELYAKEMEQPTPTQSGTISITVNKGLEADIDLLWQVNSADIEALENAKATLENLKNKTPLKYQSMIYQLLALISKALGMSHSDAFQRIIEKARGE